MQGNNRISYRKLFENMDYARNSTNKHHIYQRMRTLQLLRVPHRRATHINIRVEGRTLDVSWF